MLRTGPAFCAGPSYVLVIALVVTMRSRRELLWCNEPLVRGAPALRCRVLAAAAFAVACGSRTELDPGGLSFGGGPRGEDVPGHMTPPTPSPSVPTCPRAGGPEMVLLPEGYCIDSTEVTRAHYRAWLEKNPSTGSQGGPCQEDRTLVPDGACLARASCQTDCDAHPQVCVSWCDADAYCRGVGKRLCGKIGGGAYPSEEIYYWTRADLNEWFNACSAHSTQKYGNGVTYTPGTCNGPELGRGTVPVGSMSACQAKTLGYQGVFDLSGNVAEWEGGCETYRGCRRRGGNYFSSSKVEGLSCAVDNWGLTPAPGEDSDWFTGFRCCATPA